MKISVSLPEEDVAFLDAYAEAQRLASRSATLHRAIPVAVMAEIDEALRLHLAL